MKQGIVVVDQIDKNGNIIPGFDESLSRNEILSVIREHFFGVNLIECEGQYMMLGEYRGIKYTLRCKNITYLGNPHPAFKKRIQIANDLFDFYRISKKLGAIPILLGIYSYKGNIVFTDFDLETFINKKAHNSSAHIYSQDISNAVKHGMFSKEDYFKNHILAFRTDRVEKFLTYKLDIDRSDDFRIEIARVMDSFFAGVPMHWDGISCYQQMIDCNYKNKFQPEWPGFYLEYLLDKYIQESGLKQIQYAQDKSKGGIDLDLYFPTVGSYGDLKAHSDYSSAIQGNDWETIEHLVFDEKQSIYYIVLEHETRKDKDFGFEVTEFWNRSKNKENLRSYGNKMKKDVTLSQYFILDINADNFKYLVEFHQGKNSNDKPRNKKIMIRTKDIPTFLVYSKTFDGR